MRRVIYQRGDTLIEVIMAVAVFSMVAVGALAMMNQGVAAVQRSLEITQVRAQMDGQAEALRFIHQNLVAGDADSLVVWETIMDEARNEATPYGLDATTNQCPTLSDEAFVINPRRIDAPTEIISAVEPISDATHPPFSQLVFDDVDVATGYGLWVEAVPDDATDPAYVDFHIRACWNTVGQSVPILLGTIVRLHVPEL